MASTNNIHLPPLTSINSQPPMNFPPSPGRNPQFIPVPLRAKTHQAMELEDYFSGPRDMKHHSKWPTFLRVHGSVLPKMILPLLFVGSWATAITVISKYIKPLTVDSVLLTVLGFVVGLGLSFRSSTAYERYAEGCKYWASLLLSSRNLARVIWIHAQERHDDTSNPELGKQDLLCKLSALNLINAFAVALKHRLRFEPSTDYPDLLPLVDNLSTMAGLADKAALQPKKRNKARVAGEYLGVPFAESNPRKVMKKSKDNLGNLPLEILTYLQSYADTLLTNGTMPNGLAQSHVMLNLSTLADVATGCERVLNHPMPIAYSISIAQITWVYVVLLPFQLYEALGWISIPGSLFASYIILGIAAIGQELENPFGHDVNDLPLDSYCRELAADIDVLTSQPKPEPRDWVQGDANRMMWPLSSDGWAVWRGKSVEEIRRALRMKAVSAEVKMERVRNSIAVGEERAREARERELAVESEKLAGEREGSESTAGVDGDGASASGSGVLREREREKGVGAGAPMGHDAV